jgi:nitroreductase
MASADTITTIMARRSVRAYEPMPIPDEDLRTILEATRQAPSAANRQPLHFVVVRDPQQKRRVAEAAAQQHWLAQADAIVVAVGFPAQSARWYPVDAAIALENLVLAATSLGYGTCWIGAFSEPQVKDVVGLPEEARVIALTPLGRPAESPAARPRKPFEQLFSLDRYGQAMK